jgi:hypothetical protein
MASDWPYRCTVTVVADNNVTVTDVAGVFKYSDKSQSRFGEPIDPGDQAEFDSLDDKYVTEFSFVVTCHVGSEGDQNVTRREKADPGKCLTNKPDGEGYGYLINPASDAGGVGRALAASSNARASVVFRAERTSRGRARAIPRPQGRSKATPIRKTTSSRPKTQPKAKRPKKRRPQV